MRVVSSLYALVAVISVAVPLVARAQAPSEPQKLYCLESQDGARNCIYESLDRCEKIAGPHSGGGRCVINPAHVGTTGSGNLVAPRGSGQHSLDRLPAPVR